MFRIFLFEMYFFIFELFLLDRVILEILKNDRVNVQIDIVQEEIANFYSRYIYEVKIEVIKNH